MQTKITLLLIAAIFALVSFNLQAVEVKKKEIHNFEGFLKGEFKGTGLDSKGRLFIGPVIKQVTGPGREYYLSLVSVPNGDIYVGTGHKASVYLIKKAQAGAAVNEKEKSNIQEIFSADYLDIYALQVKSNGDVYAGTSPDGKIYKIPVDNKDKKGVEFFDPGEKFIWDIKEDMTGNLICAVGNAGGVYRIDKSGNGALIFTPEDNHIISLHITRSNSILAGSGDRGILYRIDNRKAEVLFDSPFEEIRGICEDKDGNIYFGATKGIYTRQASAQAAAHTSGNRPTADQIKAKNALKIPYKSILYRLGTNGVVEPVWQSLDEYIYAVHYDNVANSVLVGTGNSGRLYRINPDRSFAIIYESESAQIFKITGNNNRYSLAANNTSSLVTIEDTLNSTGTYYSEIFDLQIQSRLGRLYWDALQPTGTGVQFFVRTGNSNVPDATWTQWSAPFTAADNANLGVADTRYFQLKIVLNTADASKSPLVESFNAYYLQSNLGPRLQEITVGIPSAKKIKTDSGFKLIKPRHTLSATWKAEDQNEDTLKFNVFIKKVDARQWIAIGKNLTETKMDLDTRLYEDGKYLMKVSADDELSNPPDAVKQHELESSPFLIDSTAPRVSAFTVTDKRLRFDVEDDTSIIASVLYSLDGKLWYPVFPKDMLNDSKAESYEFTLNTDKKLVFLKVVDEFDNEKVFQKEY